MSEPLVPINLVSMPAEMDYDFAANRVMWAWWLPKPSPSRSSHEVFARRPTMSPASSPTVPPALVRCHYDNRPHPMYAIR